MVLYNSNMSLRLSNTAIQRYSTGFYITTHMLYDGVKQIFSFLNSHKIRVVRGLILHLQVRGVTPLDATIAD